MECLDFACLNELVSIMMMMMMMITIIIITTTTIIIIIITTKTSVLRYKIKSIARVEAVA